MTHPENSSAAPLPDPHQPIVWDAPPAGSGPAPGGGYEPWPTPDRPGGYHPAAAHHPPPGGMPATVRTAQIVSILAGVAGLVLTVAIGVAGGAEAAGAAVFGFGAFVLLALCATSFGGGGSGVRSAALTLAGLCLLCGFGGTAARNPPGVLGILVGLTVIILLSQRSARDWFGRPH